MSRRTRWRFGVGPVFVYECLTSSRRWQIYAMRAGFLLLLLITLVTAWSGLPVRASTPIRTMATVGKWFYLGVVAMQLTLVFLAAPAATAGSICLDRARGTLTHMLVTDLSSAEIVLGKLAARLVPVLGLLACTLPLMEILASVGGIDPDALLGAFVVTVGVAVLGSSLAMFFSLCVGKTHEAILSTYAVWCVWLLWPSIVSVLSVWFPWVLALPQPFSSDPFWLALAPYKTPRLVAWQDYALFFVGTLGASALLLSVTIVRFRAIMTRSSLKRQHSRSLFERFRQRFAPNFCLPSPSLDWNPVYWRERHRARPSRWSRAVVTLYFALAATFSLTAVAFRGSALAPWLNGFQVSIGLLILSITAAVSLAEERVGGSIYVLMTTMLSTRQIVLGKWLGTFRAVPLFAVLPALVCLGFAYDRPEKLCDVLTMIVYVFCSGAAITSLGLAMATWSSRVGSAVASTVSVYVAITLGSIFIALMLGPPGEGLLMCSPFAWSTFMTFKITDNRAAFDSLESWAVLWLFVIIVAAIALLIATGFSFDRKLGRGESAPLRMMNACFTSREKAFRSAFLGISAVATVVAMFGGARFDFGYLISGAQVLIGLLLAAIAATNSAAAHFQRDHNGSPVWAGQSPLKCVLARWLGACRLVAVTAILAGLAVIPSWKSGTDILDRIWLVPIYVLFAGGAWCAFGVALGMRFDRGKALRLFAAAYAFATIGAAIAALLFLDIRQSPVVLAASPFVTILMMTVRSSVGASSGLDIFEGALAATGLNAVAISILLAAAVFILDRRTRRLAQIPANSALAAAN